MIITNNSFGANNLRRSAARPQGAQNPCVVARPDGGTCTDPIGPKGPFGPFGPHKPTGDEPPAPCFFGWGGAWMDLLPHMFHLETGHLNEMA